MTRYEKIRALGLSMKNIRIYDNGGKTFDRFTVIYLNEPEDAGLYGARGMSEQPFHPQGFGQYCTASPGRHLGKRISFDQLPIDCQRLVIQDLGELPISN